MLIARDNQTHFLNALKLVNVPGAKSAKIDWMFEAEQMDMKTPKKDRGVEEAVDMLLGML